MSLRDPRAITRGHEFLERVGARCFQESVARGLRGEFGNHERLVDERSEHVEKVELVEPIIATDRDGGLHREPIDEDANALKESFFAIVEEIVAPVDQRAQRLLSWQRIAASAGEDAETFVEAFRELMNVDHLDAGCGEFDCERDAVETLDDLDNSRCIAVRELETHVGSAGSIDKENHRSVTRCVSCGESGVALRVGWKFE